LIERSRPIKSWGSKLIRPAEGQAGDGRPFLLLPFGGSGDAQFAVVACAQISHHLHHLIGGSFNPRLAGGGEHQDRDGAFPQALLIAQVGVGGDQQFQALLLSQADQIAIGHGGPALPIGRAHPMDREGSAQRGGSTHRSNLHGGV
jgi:hypothetical protein